MTNLVIAVKLHDLDLDKVISWRILEITEELDVGVILSAVIVVFGVTLNLELAIRMQSSILHLYPELVGVIASAVPIRKLMEVNMNHLDVKRYFLGDVFVFKLMQIIIYNFFSHEKLVLNGWKNSSAPMLVVESFVRHGFDSWC